MENLVVYYSNTGHCKHIASTLGGDHIEIQIAEQLPKFKFMQMFKLMMMQNKEHIQINHDAVDFDKYGEITFITPVWGGRPAKPVVQFIENAKLKNKSIILIASSNNGKPKKTFDLLKEKLTGNNVRHTLKYKRTQIQP